MEKVIYDKHIVSRVLHYFFYYWMVMTALLFVPLFIFGVYFTSEELLLLLRHDDGHAGNMSIMEAWLYWLLTVALSVGGIWYLYHTFRKMLKPLEQYEGFVVEKHRDSSDEGYYYYIILNIKMDKKFELSTTVFEKIHEGQKVKIFYSDKLDTVMRIESV